MFRSRTIVMSLWVLALAACGDDTTPSSMDDGSVDATPDASEEPTRWVPTSAAVWYAADYDETIFSDDDGTLAAPGDEVRRWADILGNEAADGRIDAPGIMKSSIGGKPSLQFDGGMLECLNLDIANDVPAISVVAIYRATASDTSADIWSASTSVSNNVRATLFRSISDETNKGTGGRRLDEDAFAGATADEPLVNEETHLSIGVLDYANGEIRLHVDDVAVAATGAFSSSGNTSATDSANVWIGTKHGLESNRFFGHIHELVIYQRTLSDQEIEDIAAHARDHWGVALEN